MDYKNGFANLKKLLQEKNPEILPEIATFEARFAENERSMRIFGPSENRKAERYEIVYALNLICQRECLLSFQDLCQLPSPGDPGPKKDSDDRKGNRAQATAPVLYGKGSQWAVIAGVNTYEDWQHYGTLKVCLNDAHALAGELVTRGFDESRVHILGDDLERLPSKNNILESLQSVANATETDDLLLFYYSGHGDLDAGGEAYLVARDGRSLVLPDSGIPIRRVKNIMEGARARAKIIILDACHSGAHIPGKGPVKMTAEFIQRVFEQSAGLAILASCKQQELSYEWQSEERSVFTHFLLEALRGNADFDQKNFVTIQDINRYVSDGVRRWASSHFVTQTPTFEYRGAGDMILARTEPPG